MKKVELLVFDEKTWMKGRQWMSVIVDEINRKFRDILEGMEKESPGTVREIFNIVNRNFIEKGCYLRGRKPNEPRTFPIFMKPYFIPRSRIEYVTYANNVMMNVLEKVTDLYYTEPSLRPLFELKPEEVELSEIESGLRRKVKITRNDAFLTDDSFKIIEFNCDSPGGPMYSDVQSELIGHTPVMWELRKNYNFHSDRFMPVVVKTLLEAYREFGGKKERPFIGLIAGEGGATLPEFKLISKWLRETQGYDSEYSDPRRLEYDGKALRTASGKIIDIIYRRGWLPDWTGHMDEIKPLIHAYRDGKVCVCNPPSSILAANKSLLSVIQVHEGIRETLTEEEKKVIREVVPWTRFMKEGKTDDIAGKPVDLYDYVVKNRKKLILKPMDQYGGKDVCIGPDTNQSTWEKWIKKTADYPFVVQEYVSIPEEELPEVDPKLVWKPKKINVNFYAYDGWYAGGMVRTSENSIINISAGGGLIPVEIVEGF